MLSTAVQTSPLTFTHHQRPDPLLPSPTSLLHRHETCGMKTQLFPTRHPLLDVWTFGMSQTSSQSATVMPALQMLESTGTLVLAPPQLEATEGKSMLSLAIGHSKGNWASWLKCNLGGGKLCVFRQWHRCANSATVALYRATVDSSASSLEGNPIATSWAPSS